MFKQSHEIINTMGHLTHNGLEKLVSIKESMNFGISDELKVSFLEITPTPRPLVTNQSIRDPF